MDTTFLYITYINKIKPRSILIWWFFKANNFHSVTHLKMTVFLMACVLTWSWCGVGVTANLQKKKNGASCTGRESIQSSILHLDWVMLTTFLFFYKCQHPLEWSVRLFLWQPQHGDQWGLCVYLAWHLKSLFSSENNVLGSWQMQMMWWCFMATRHVWGSRNESEFRRDERWKGDGRQRLARNQQALPPMAPLQTGGEGGKATTLAWNE